MGAESLETGHGRSVRVFMSYRRADDRHFIGRLHDRLCDAFGEEQVFRDIDSIPAGTNFRQVILRTLDEVDAVVAVIGPNWARTSGDDGAASTDYVFMELIEALKHGKPVVPVLIEDTLIPAPDGLPADLRALREINAISVHADPAFRRDSERLVEAIHAVVTDDRVRIARERQVADERARQAEAERLQREQRVDQLRAEERAARARLAELEDVATRRHIEMERDRLEAIEAELRRAESPVQGPPAAPPATAPQAASARPPAPPVITPDIAAVAPKPAPLFEPPMAPAAQAPRTPPTATAGQADVPVFELLIIAALVLGVVGLFLNRSVVIDDGLYQFNEMSSKSQVDIMVMLLAVVIAVPLFLGRRPVEQRFVLAGIAVSTFIFGFVHASAIVRSGPTGFSEGSWMLVKIAQIVCLGFAYQMLRRRSPKPIPSPPRFRVPLVVIAIGCAALLVAATIHEWNDAVTLVDESFTPDRSPLLVWLVLLALLPIGVTVVLAARGSYAAQLTLATVATLAVLTYFADAGDRSNDYVDNGSTWAGVAMAYLLLAAVAWSVVIARARSASPSN